MKTLILGGLAVGLIILGLFLWHRFGSSKALDLAPPAGEPERPSIFEAIQQHVRISPDTPLDDEKLPPMPAGEEGLKFAPGLADALFGSGQDKGNDWKIVRGIVRAINAGRLSNWRVAEKNIGEIPASSFIDKVLSSLTYADITPAVRKVFWDMAKGSRRYEAVKWGIGIGGVGLRPDEVADLLLLARHGEFSLYASHALSRASEVHPELKKHLVDLLPVSYQWGVVHIVDYIVQDAGLIRQKEVQRDVLIYGMENVGFIEMEVAFTIAKAIDLPAFCLEARGDDRLCRAVVSLMDTLINEPSPLGGLAQLDDWQAVTEAYIAMLRERPADARLLAALRSLERFLDDDKLKWARRGPELEQVRRTFADRLSPAVLRRGLELKADRWYALQIIQEKALRELLPDVEAAFDQEPDAQTARILSELGERQQLEVMLKRLPTLIDLEARRSAPFSLDNINGPEYRHDFVYAQIIEGMGRLATQPAIARIKAAAADVNPLVRAAACKAVVQLPLDVVDDGLRTLVRARLDDSPPYVVEAARTAAKHIGILK